MSNASSVLARTLEVVHDYPLNPVVLVDAVLAAWDGLANSRIGKAAIGFDVFPSPQVVGAFLHELVPLEIREIAGRDWRGDQFLHEKDLVHVPNSYYSAEIKTSSAARQIFGNRSFGQPGLSSDKKEKSGYYLAVNFTGWPRDGASLGWEPGVNLIRFGWLDHIDWLAQDAPSGQAASLPPAIENWQLLTLYDVNR